MVKDFVFDSSPDPDSESDSSLDGVISMKLLLLLSPLSDRGV